MEFLDLLFPKACLGCQKVGAYICPSCINNLPVLKQTCPYCEKASVDGVTHIRCALKLGLDGVYSVWPYQGILRTAILKLKYKFATEIVDELSEFIAFKLRRQDIFPKSSILVPVPLYWIRQNYRGFNQSEVVGKFVAEKMGWRFNPDLLLRKRLNRPQTELKGKERRINVRGVFSLNPSYELVATSYVLFDDVYTTGSTLKEAAKVLKRNGVRQVWGFTIAR